MVSNPGAYATMPAAATWARPLASASKRDAGSVSFDRARSRLYRGQNLQENMRWKALVEIYTKHSFAPFSNLNFVS